MGRIVELEELLAMRREWRHYGTKVVFTNGCFDLIHRGHVEYLQKARALADVLVVGLNTDESVRRLKGPSRPILPQEDRASILAAFECVDYVVLFDEDTPLNLIRALEPEILAKGEDYQVHEIVGHDLVQAYGGKVVRIPLTPGRATSRIITQILTSQSQPE
ncbi:MAG: D-glycero-beta-D-manno-heptose 1-phosphate adenylyltransferase [candidate division KSB1 bacterium]|nr:D-glycero-beta-D-manno-heptose 1-phosphate adenylyltransferase [candidate division KSB1 bacterium]MDZ7302740.1 D-glycero-beta-D-manno-heptose 1-phosphate adenylyltransferase [candidate division KSB1 bacterium]MDZ7310091.1 D-glycero-beta-D-manno-heptose 1-phosphate adenylyltransferase [candidate division KSB1 bacterium]